MLASEMRDDFHNYNAPKLGKVVQSLSSVIYFSDIKYQIIEVKFKLIAVIVASDRDAVHYVFGGRKCWNQTRLCLKFTKKVPMVSATM